ncbi:hypothetical protein [Agrococcus sp. ARC_14]|uniref:hypothetical protein n=1 Tax=Agrococcus sp. ARC_14 TaxID=2919927 RepID=UPI001F05BE11|nr:hypothetical protein [Agrococcus sp. ARC_14]MCH1882520.1 hypothetical protein [Agrococcus sp. ARC_14]
MNRRDIGDAATVLTLLQAPGRPKGLRSLVSGWDMLQADVPDRERMETAWSILIGSGLAEVDSDWCLRLTADGDRMRRAVRERGGMRTAQAEIAGRLAQEDLAATPLQLPAEVFDRAVRAYRGSGGRTVGRPKDSGRLRDAVARLRTSARSWW